MIYCLLFRLKEHVDSNFYLLNLFHLIFVLIDLVPLKVLEIINQNPRCLSEKIQLCNLGYLNYIYFLLILYLECQTKYFDLPKKVLFLLVYLLISIIALLFYQKLHGIYLQICLVLEILTIVFHWIYLCLCGVWYK